MTTLCRSDWVETPRDPAPRMASIAAVLSVDRPAPRVQPSVHVECLVDSTPVSHPRSSDPAPAMMPLRELLA